MLKILFLIIISYSSNLSQKDYRMKDGWTGSPLPIYAGLHFTIKNRNTYNYLSSSASMDTIAIVKPPRENENFLHIFDEIPDNLKQNDCKYEIKSRNWNISYCITSHPIRGYYRSKFNHKSFYLLFQWLVKGRPYTKFLN